MKAYPSTIIISHHGMKNYLKKKLSQLVKKIFILLIMETSCCQIFFPISVRFNKFQSNKLLWEKTAGLHLWQTSMQSWLPKKSNKNILKPISAISLLSSNPSSSSFSALPNLPKILNKVNPYRQPYNLTEALARTLCIILVNFRRFSNNFDKDLQTKTKLLRMWTGFLLLFICPLLGMHLKILQI